MLWLIATIFSYFLFSLTPLGDKYLLKGPLPNPKIYSFYVGMLGILALALIPFGFTIPSLIQLLFSFFAGALAILFLVVYFSALQKFEPSRIIPAMGGILPLFTFGLVYIIQRYAALPQVSSLFLSANKQILNSTGLVAFFLLILGSVVISIEKEKLVTFKSFQVSVILAALGSLSLLAAKIVYLYQPFLTGFILMRIGGVLAVLFFLFSKGIRREIFKATEPFWKKTAAFLFQKKRSSLSISNNLHLQEKSYKTVVLFFLVQTIGAGATILQQWAIFLAPLSYLAIINALQGVQYVFLFIFATLLSLKFPKILKERISNKILYQKLLAILFISAGLIILAVF